MAEPMRPKPSETGPKRTTSADSSPLARSRSYSTGTSAWPSLDTVPGDPKKSGRIYRAIVWWGGLLVRHYFRVEVVGETFPEHTPVLLVQNHTNGLCDAHLLMSATDRPIRILVKYKLMTAPVLGWMLRGIDAVPMYRRKDGVDTRQNAKSFEAIDEALRQNSVIALFPEGESLNSIGLRELRSGVARMAISAEESGTDIGLQVVPVGVTYECRDRMRSLASTVIGPPIDVAPLLPRDPERRGNRATINAIMAKITEGMKELIPHAENAEDYETAVALERIAKTTARPIGLRRKDALAKVVDDSDETSRDRHSAVRDLGERLSSARLRGDEVLAPAPSFAETYAGALLWAPLLLFATPFWIPLAILAVVVSRFPKTPDKVVTLRVLFGYTGLVLSSIVAIALGAWFGGLKGALMTAAAFFVASQVFTPALDGFLAMRTRMVRRALDRNADDCASLQRAIRSVRDAYGLG